MDKKALVDARFKLLSDEGPGTLGMYLSTFHNWDKVRPIPEKPVRGAFEKHLPAFIKDGFIAEYHDWGKRPIATVTHAREDDIGLWVEAEFHTTHDAQEARLTAKERLARGKSVKSSMGYEVLDDELVDMDDDALKAQGIKQGRLLKDVPLYEGSIVNVPANSLADITSVKGILPAGMPFDASSDAVLAAVKEYVSRATGLHQLRAKEGRVLSTQNRQKLTTLHTSLADVMAAIEELLAATEPKATEDETRKARTQFLRLMTQRRALLSEIRSN